MNRIFDKSRGQMMVLYSGALAFALAGAVALCTDVAIMYVNWEQLQKAADAAVLAGANYLPDDTATAISTANTFSVNNNSIQASEIVSGPTVSNANQNISITLKRTVPYNFGKVLGLTSADVQVTATAQAQNVGGAGGNHLIPVGFACPSPPCVSPGQNLLLPGELGGPPSNNKVSPGNWGLLRFPDGQKYQGNGFNTTLANGYQGTAPILLGLNGGVTTSPGNDVNKLTQPGLTTRYDSGTLTMPLPTPMTPADFADPRIVEIPMISSWPNGDQEVDITGFITAVLLPDGSGTFYAQVVSISLGSQIGDPNGPNTGTFSDVLIN
jgi:hypothetical protein